MRKRFCIRGVEKMGELWVEVPCRLSLKRDLDQLVPRSRCLGSDQSPFPQDVRAAQLQPKA